MSTETERQAWLAAAEGYKGSPACKLLATAVVKLVAEVEYLKENFATADQVAELTKDFGLLAAEQLRGREKELDRANQRIAALRAKIEDERRCTCGSYSDNSHLTTCLEVVMRELLEADNLTTEERSAKE